MNQPTMKKNLKTKKFYGDKVNTNFRDNGMPKEGCHYIYLSKTLINSVFNTSKNYYPQKCLEKSKYVVQEKR